MSQVHIFISSVQVMLFSDRLEVWNPGILSPVLTVEKKEDQPLTALMSSAGRTNRTKFRDQVLKPLLDARLLEMTKPDKPKSSRQRYRLTQRGMTLS